MIKINAPESKKSHVRQIVSDLRNNTTKPPTLNSLRDQVAKLAEAVELLLDEADS